jgi:hypothetical protein
VRPRKAEAAAQPTRIHSAARRGAAAFFQEKTMNKHYLSLFVAASGLALALSAPASQAAEQAGPKSSAVVAATPGEQHAVEHIGQAQHDIGRRQWKGARNRTEQAETALLNAQQLDPNDARLQQALEQTNSARLAIKGKQVKAADGQLAAAASDLAAAPAPGPMSGSSPPPAAAPLDQRLGRP